MDVLFLKRTDDESITRIPRNELEKMFEGLTFKIVDWYDIRDAGFHSGAEKHPLTELAITRSTVAGKILQQGRIVISDRLHAVILSLLADIPVISLDNEYGKIEKVVGHVYFTSKHCKEGLMLSKANNVSEALMMARQLLSNDNSLINRVFQRRGSLPHQ